MSDPTFSDADPPPGWARYRRFIQDGQQYSELSLFLPGLLQYRLVKEELERFERLDRERAKRLSKALRSSPATSKATKESQPKPVDAAEKWSPRSNPPKPGVDYDPVDQHPVYSLDNIQDRLDGVELKTSDPEWRKNDRQVLSLLLDKGSLRKVGRPSNGRAALDELRLRQPHFGEVIDHVANQLALAQTSGRPLHIPPILLIGPPEVGKTHFTQELAKALQTTVRRQPFDNESTAASLLGSERKWSNTQSGIVFNLVCLGEHANPILLLDEIDKARRLDGQDPLAPLHSLLEPATASKVRDISADIEFDASLIIWISTANRPEKLVGALRSRFREFYIDRPTAAQALAMAPAIVASAMKRLGMPDFELPSHSLIRKLAHLTPRELCQAIELAVAAAVSNGRRQLLPSDVPAEFLDEDGHESLLLH